MILSLTERPGPERDAAQTAGAVPVEGTDLRVPLGRFAQRAGCARRCSGVFGGRLVPVAGSGPGCEEACPVLRLWF